MRTVFDLKVEIFEMETLLYSKLTKLVSHVNELLVLKVYIDVGFLKPSRE